MGCTMDRVKGVANQAGGKVKEGIGRAIGNEPMQVEGVAQPVKGKRKAKDPVKDTANKIADKANENL